MSKFLSAISLIVHPADRMMSAPSPNKLMYVNGVVIGACTAYDAIVIDHAGSTETHRNASGTAVSMNAR